MRIDGVYFDLHKSAILYTSDLLARGFKVARRLVAAAPAPVDILAAAL